MPHSGTAAFSPNFSRLTSLVLSELVRRPVFTSSRRARLSEHASIPVGASKWMTFQSLIIPRQTMSTR
jgi:hypothetical protein